MKLTCKIIYYSMFVLIMAIMNVTGQIAMDRNDMTPEMTKESGFLDEQMSLLSDKNGGITGCKIKASDAEKIAKQAHIDKYGNASMFLTPWPAREIRIGYDIDGFAKKYESLWQVQVGDGVDASILFSIIWIHPDSGHTYIVCGPPEVEIDLNALVAVVETEAAAEAAVEQGAALVVDDTNGLSLQVLVDKGDALYDTGDLDRAEIFYAAAYEVDYYNAHVLGRLHEITRKKNATSLKALLSLLPDETEANRRHIVRALGNIGGETCEARLLEMLESEKGIILGDVARSLGQIKSEAALDRLRQFLDHEIDWVKSSSRWAIRQIEGTHNK